MSKHARHPEYTHQHGFACGHVAIIHAGHTDYLHDGHLQYAHLDHVNHFDYLVDGHLHHPHGNHCDDHGPVAVRRKP
jgi:hypothetical protein